MISKEEMYEFASLIAGITDSDLEAYKCGGKTKKKAEGGNIFDKVKGVFTPVRSKVDKEISKKKKPTMKAFPGTSDEETKRKLSELKSEKIMYPNRFKEDGSRKWKKSLDKKTNEDQKPK